MTFYIAKVPSLLHLKSNKIFFKPNLFQNGLNWRIQSIHVINVKGSASLAQRVMDFLNKFFSAVLISRVIIYENPEDLLKHIPTEFLPEDYGGCAPNSSVLIGMLVLFQPSRQRRMISFRLYFFMCVTLKLRTGLRGFVDFIYLM